MNLEDEAWLRIGVAGALSRDLRGGEKGFLDRLAEVFTQAFPHRTQLKYSGGIFAKKQLAGLSVEIGDHQYTLAHACGSLSPSMVHVVRGIALKSEPMAMEEWIAAVSEGLEESVRQDSAAKAALSKMLGLV